ncbi:D-alanyl-D-alanine carboxypeptidase/D-alanyl-D-alanine-endopeptidase [Cyanobacteria bacterium FACHB-472]|nr:D-alanyl-D-alanine carboxypeptidase/D-alanyl-D-alanine-endopeptidase [Cyanobacteria bacterium FACHB-472]
MKKIPSKISDIAAQWEKSDFQDTKHPDSASQQGRQDGCATPIKKGKGYSRLIKISEISSLILILNTPLLSWHQAAQANNQSSHPDKLNTAQVSQTQKPQSAALCPSQLTTAIDAITKRPQWNRARWGILIEPLTKNSILYSREQGSYFIPASNVKVLTTAAALHKLGSQHRIRTSIYGTGDGSLRVVGRGDPSLTDAQLRDLAQQLKRRGITQVKQLIAEDDYFKGQAVNTSWEWGDLQANYGAPVNSLILNQNAATLTISPQTPGKPLQTSWADPLALTQWRIENNSVTTQAKSPASIELNAVLGKPVLQIKGQLPADAKPVSLNMAIINPADYFLRHLRRTLAIEGITVAEAMVGANSQPPIEELAAVESPPLGTLLAQTNQNSNNLYAEVLLRSLGTTATAQSDSSLQQGLAALKQTLTELGVDPSSYVLNDGSGLSRHNLVSPVALVQTLKAIAKTPEAAIYLASLPVAGKSGSLLNRFQNTPAQGIVQAKTGTMSGVVSLSGYMSHPEYETIVFSIIVNQSDQSAATVRQAIDEIVLLLTRLKKC